MYEKTIGYTLACISAICLGITNFLFSHSSKTIGSSNTIFYYYVCAIFIATAFWFPFHENKSFKFSDFQWPVYIALAMFVSNLTYSYSVVYFDTSTPAIIRAISFFVTGMIALFLNKEYLSLKDWLAFCLVFAGVVLFGYGRQGFK